MKKQADLKKIKQNTIKKIKLLKITLEKLDSRITQYRTNELEEQI